MNTPETLFHFTNSFEKLENILLDKFYGSFCKEKIYCENIEEFFIVPMISFCDISLKEIGNQTYGKYGIGLKKNWGMQNGLNPILYIEKKSFLAKSFMKSMDNLFIQYKQLSILDQEIIRLKKMVGEISSSEKIKDINDKLKESHLERNAVSNSIDFILYSALYTKHYQDDLIKGDGEIIKDYIFYKEREWRYVPSQLCQVNNLLNEMNDYNSWRIKGQDKSLLSSVNLSFDVKDINYIIVETEIEIEKMIKVIDIGFGKRISKDIKNILISKLLYYEGIVKDF